jgi:hypothetical protein
MTPELRRRLDAAVQAIPDRQRKQHLTWFAFLLHLVEHCTEGREPYGFVAGYRAYRSPGLRWAAELLERPLAECPECADPDHVTLITQPVGLTGPA